MAIPLLFGCGVTPGDADFDASLPLAAPKTTPTSCKSALSNPAPLNIIGGDMVMMPAGCNPTAGLPVGISGRHVLFINFEGIDLRNGDNSLEDSALRNTMAMLPDVITMDPFDPENDKRFDSILAIHKKVSGWYSDMNLDVVISRPLSGDYMMTVVGDNVSKIGLNPPIVGISPADCRNQNEADVDYAFTGSLVPPHNVDQSAVTAAHEAGHAFGLGHVQNMMDIMYPSVSPAIGFVGGEVYDAGPCNAMPGDYQDSHQVLLNNLGGRPPELEKPYVSPQPVVHIVSPADGATVGRQVVLAIAADTQVKNGIDHVTLSVSKADGKVYRGGHPVAELRPPNSSVQINITSPGNYQLVATAYDHFGNAALTHTTFSVASVDCAQPNDCAPGQKCTDTHCVTPPLPDKSPTMNPDDALRRYGSACEATSECVGGTCAVTPVGQICTHYCNPDRLCVSGLECVDGICLPPIYPRSTPKLGQLGGKCSRNQDCFSGECSPSGDPSAPRYCTQSCDADVAWSCPSTMSCTTSDTATGMRPVCLLKPSGQMAPAAGCEMSQRGLAPGAERLTLFAMLAMLSSLLLLGRRRRQRLALAVAQVRRS